MRKTKKIAKVRTGTMKETDLFPIVRDLFLESDMEIYTEVPCKNGRADIVAVRDNLVTIVEMKVSMSLQLLEQAYNRTGAANYIYVAVPAPKGKLFISWYVRRLAKNDGIGIILVDTFWNIANIYLPAKLNRNAKTAWAKTLAEGYKHDNNTPGGLSGGGYYTPYKNMIDRVRRYIERYHPEPVSLEDILENVDLVTHHYANPKNGLFKALTTYEKDWCEPVKIGRKTYFKLRKVKRTPVL